MPKKLNVLLPSIMTPQSTQSFCNFLEGGEYGDARMPNWHHTDTTPSCPESNHWDCIGVREEHFEAGNLSAPISPLPWPPIVTGLISDILGNSTVGEI